jgi:hypothetical protein
MIAPDMATMLSYVFTDAPIAAPALQALLSAGVKTSFNAITVDSDTSTSDTLLAFATQAAARRGAPRIEAASDRRLIAFRKAFEHGGLFLFGETDGSMPGALLAFNTALANDWMDFPDGVVRKHPNFRVVADANTFGTGADRLYVGRNQLDAASLDRYAVIEWTYDEALEAAMIGLPAPKGSPAPATILPREEAEIQGLTVRWFDRVRKVRGAVMDLKVRHVVSPRATVNGIKLLAAGWDWHNVEEAVIWKGLDADTKNKVQAKAA